MRAVLCFALVSMLAGLACGNPPSTPVPGEKAKPETAHGELVRPPFAMRGELEGLLLVWFDDKGTAHAASKRADVPEASRARVRVDALDLKPEQRLDASEVYVADLRAPQKDGEYRVEKWSRDAFEAALAPAPEPVAAASDAPVILYGASWCGACKQAAQFLTQRGVPFIEKDIEKEPAARDELMQKARAQGVSTNGIPVLDVHGKLISGFEPNVLGSLLDQAHAKRSDQGT